ncbi:hypothetical protein LLB_0215 [Legionella longbeachae D-4968]|nr:hypothetical protein LLB_0215 [Legionella longbeachae D-4968]
MGAAMVDMYTVTVKTQSSPSTGRRLKNTYNDIKLTIPAY